MQLFNVTTLLSDVNFYYAAALLPLLLQLAVQVLAKTRLDEQTQEQVQDNFSTAAMLTKRRIIAQCYLLVNYH